MACAGRERHHPFLEACPDLEILLLASRHDLLFILGAVFGCNGRFEGPFIRHEPFPLRLWAGGGAEGKGEEHRIKRANSESKAFWNL